MCQTSNDFSTGLISRFRLSFSFPFGDFAIVVDRKGGIAFRSVILLKRSELHMTMFYSNIC